MAARIGRSRPVSAYIVRPKLAAQTVASIDVTLGNVTMDWAGTPTPPDGSISVTLNNVTMALAGTADGAGSFTLQLSSVTEAFAGSVNPSGDFSLQLSSITMTFGSETQPFGEQVLHIDAEHRAFRVIEEDPGLIQITRSEVTQA